MCVSLAHLCPGNILVQQVKSASPYPSFHVKGPRPCSTLRPFSSSRTTATSCLRGLSEYPMEQGSTIFPYPLAPRTPAHHWPQWPLTAVDVTPAPPLAWPRFLLSSSFTGSFTRTPWYGRGGAGACSGAVAARKQCHWCSCPLRQAPAPLCPLSPRACLLI